jgi:hypothetical protein
VCVCVCSVVLSVLRIKLNSDPVPFPDTQLYFLCALLYLTRISKSLSDIDNGIEFSSRDG